MNDASYWRGYENGFVDADLDARLMAMEEERDAVRIQAATLIEALLEIRRKYGAVCLDFMTCSHVSCRDSYAAWETANQALIAEIGYEGIDAAEHCCEVYTEHGACVHTV